MGHKPVDPLAHKSLLHRIGSTIAPPRFLLFLGALVAGLAAMIPVLGAARCAQPVILQSLAAFVFNIGVLAFSINVLGS